MSGPLVSVICVCYNHERYVDEAIRSVLDQTYSNIQIVVVDDASQDDSAKRIKALLNSVGRTDIPFLHHASNTGNCRSFNDGLALATGKYVIDFATDDVMIPGRIETQVSFFEQQNSSCGVIFSDARYVSEDRSFLYDHFDDLRRKKLLTTIPEGDVFKEVLTQYFISSPTMMIRKTVLDELAGYDDTLAYEDFDFWLRSARNYQYRFTNEKLIEVRKSPKSMSTGWYKVGDKQLHSTYLVCRKAQELVRDHDEKDALIIRVRYEFRQSVFSENFYEAKLFFDLLKELTPLTVNDILLLRLSRFKLPLARLRKWYHRYKFS